MTIFPLVDLTAIILAGGQSSRMGQDKALLSRNGIPLLTRICQVAQSVAPTVYVVTPWVERYQMVVPEDCHLLPECWPPDCQRSPGPLWGFSQALPFCQTTWVLLLACDLPCLTVADLQTISQYLISFIPISATTMAILPRSTQGWEPLCGFYRTACGAELTQFLNQGGRSFQKWLSQQSVAELPTSHRRFLFNCNTPEDWLGLE
jgi:molybdopterin-guanine dinucleotide biosynthesis protein A